MDSMADPERQELGWRIEVDAETDEIRLDHPDAGSAYVLDSGGGLRVPGDGSVGEQLRDLRTTFSSALDAEAQEGTTDPVDIESTRSITVRAPIVEVSGVRPVEVSSYGGVDISGTGAPNPRLELPGGIRYPVAPVEGDGPVSEFYGLDTTNRNSAALPEAFMVEDATVTFLYRNGETGDRSLVFVNDVPTGDTDGSAVLTVEGATGAEWLVRDDPENVTPPQDRYEATEGTDGWSVSAAWEWNTDRTDGGAVGPLGATFDVDIVHRASGTVGDETKERSGLERWLFVDGRDPGNPIEIATFGGGASADVSARVFVPE
jgi:hypothetical protein